MDSELKKAKGWIDPASTGANEAPPSADCTQANVAPKHSLSPTEISEGEIAPEGEADSEGKDETRLREENEAVKHEPTKPTKSKGAFLGIVDKYIIRTFLGTYFFCILIILAIAIVFDMNEKMDDFLAPEVSLYEIIVHYYLNFVPYYANIFSPLFVFISTILFTSRFAGNSEIIAMLASGMSFKRLLRPYFLSATVISLLSFTLNNFVIPPGTKVRLDFENKYIRNKRTEYASAIQLELQPGHIFYISSYTRSAKTAYDVSIDRFERGDLVGRMTARMARYDTLGRWKFNDYRDRTFTKYSESLVVGAELDTLLGIDPEDFMITANDVETLTSPEIRHYISKQKERGVGNVQLFEIEYHKRLASVFSAFILTFIGAVLSAKKVKNGMGINIAIGLGLSFAYIFFMTLTSTFAISGALPAWVAAWLPNVVFVLIALPLWRKAPQ